MCAWLRWYCLYACSQLHLLWKQTRPVYLWEYSSKVAPAPLLHLNTVLIMSGHMIFKHQLSVNSEKLCKHFSASEWTEPQILRNRALSFCIAVYVPAHQSLLISVYLYIKDLIIVNIITVLSPSLSTLHLLWPIEADGRPLESRSVRSFFFPLYCRQVLLRVEPMGFSIKCLEMTYVMIWLHLNEIGLNWDMSSHPPPLSDF